MMTGVNSGVAAFMKRWRGKEDVQNQLVGELLCSLLPEGGMGGKEDVQNQLVGEWMAVFLCFLLP